MCGVNWEEKPKSSDLHNAMIELKAAAKRCQIDLHHESKQNAANRIVKMAIKMKLTVLTAFQLTSFAHFHHQDERKNTRESD